MELRKILWVGAVMPRCRRVGKGALAPCPRPFDDRERMVGTLRFCPPYETVYEVVIDAQ
jgi:hypothetical protein